MLVHMRFEGGLSFYFLSLLVLQLGDMLFLPKFPLLLVTIEVFYTPDLSKLLANPLLILLYLSDLLLPAGFLLGKFGPHLLINPLLLLCYDFFIPILDRYMIAKHLHRF